jgi:hypothetical protein
MCDSAAAKLRGVHQDPECGRFLFHRPISRDGSRIYPDSYNCSEGDIVDRKRAQIREHDLERNRMAVVL